MQTLSPVLLVMAGPNGSGKSTVTTHLKTFGVYVNADDIKAYLNCDDLTAAQTAEKTREALLSQGADFTFETVMSTPRNIDLMRRAKEKGYTVGCIYVLTCDPQINVKRVQKRTENGGHDVPAEKVITRYKRAMQLFPELFKICDELYVYDNSKDRTEGEPEPIIRYRYGKLQTIPNSVWSQEMIDSLISGTFCEYNEQ